MPNCGMRLLARWKAGSKTLFHGRRREFQEKGLLARKKGPLLTGCFTHFLPSFMSGRNAVYIFFAQKLYCIISSLEALLEEVGSATERRKKNSRLEGSRWVGRCHFTTFHFSFPPFLLLLFLLLSLLPLLLLLLLLLFLLFPWRENLG